MRQSRIAYFTDFAVYPVLIVVMILVIADTASPIERALALAFAFMGALFWTLLEYLLHRFVLHGDTSVAELHDQHHAWPRAWIGTPTWVSVTAIALMALLPALFGFPLALTLSLTGGLMAGFLWYGFVHHAIHHGRPRRLSRALAAAARRHFAHHNAGGIGNFGVTTPLWDRLFRTSMSARNSPRRSETMPAESPLVGEE